MVCSCVCLNGGMQLIVIGIIVVAAVCAVSVLRERKCDLDLYLFVPGNTLQKSTLC
jgi:hypothetical protein